MTAMISTDDLLAELADLEVPAPKPVTARPTHIETDDAIPVIHTEPVDLLPESGGVLDERGHKILALTDLVIQEFDRAVEALTTVKDAVKALRAQLATPSAPAQAATDHLALVDEAVGAEEEEPVETAYVAPVEHNPSGEADSMDNVTIML